MSSVLDITPMAELPANWTRTTVGEIAKTSSGGTPSSKNAAYYGGDIPWVKIGDLTDGDVCATEQMITEAGLNSSSAKLLEPGTLLLAMYGSIGKLGVLRTQAATNQAICALVPSESVLPDYLFWFLRSQRSILMDMGRGGTQLNIGQGDIKNLSIPLPPLDEQERIVAVAEDLMVQIDEGRRLIDAALDGLARYRAAVLANSFGSLSCVLSDVAEVQSGIAKGRAEAGDLTDTPYIRTANVQALRLELDEIKTLPVTPQQAKRYRLEMDDVLVLEGGDADKVGRGWIWSGEIDGCLHQNHVFAVRADRTRLVPRYLAYYINAPQARAYFLSVAKQTTNLASINKTNLNALPVPVPSLEVQKTTVAALDRQLAATTEAEFELRARVVDSDGLRSSALHAAFSGMIA